MTSESGGSMNRVLKNSRYTFTLGKVKCTVEIGGAFSAIYVEDVKVPIETPLLHYHPMHELFFVFDEPVMLTDFRGTKEFRNCVVSVPPYVKHSSQRFSDYTLVFSFTCPEKHEDDFTRFFQTKFSCNEISSIAVTTPEMKVYLNDLENLLDQKKDELKNELSVSLLKLILSHIYQSSLSSIEHCDFSLESNYMIISRIISESIIPGTTVTLSTVAQKIHLSEKQTSRIIKKYFHKTLSQLVTEAKLDYASNLLSITQMPVAQVVTNANFQSENYFFSRFKEQFGCTPLQYRKKHHSKQAASGKNISEGDTL